MKDSLEAEIAKSMEAEPELIPYLPELVADIWALGSSPELYIELLQSLNLPPENTKVLDLGCGKGAVAITMADKLGFSVLGVDGFKPFLEEAKQKAVEHKVSERCRFEFADVREFVKSARGFDVVVYASVGNILGGFAEYVGKLRRTVRPGGYILIDDCFLKGSIGIERKGYEYIVPRDETLKQLTSYGDKILREVVFTDEETRAFNRQFQELISRRGKELIEKQPELVDTISQYLKNQEVGCEVIDKYFAGAVWLIERKIEG